MKGVSYTFFTTDNAKAARELVGILQEAKAVVPPQLLEMSHIGGGGGRGECFFPLRMNSFPFLICTSSTGRYGGGGGGRGRGGGGGWSRGGGGGGGRDGGWSSSRGGNDRW